MCSWCCRLAASVMAASSSRIRANRLRIVAEHSSRCSSSWDMVRHSTRLVPSSSLQLWKMSARYPDYENYKHYPDYENYKHYPDYENYKHSYNLVPSSSLQSCKMSPRYPDYVNYKPSSDLFHSSSLQFWNMLHRSISGLQNLL